jgi:LmbE family N-acetylglucosaminyl deacetylase
MKDANTKVQHQSRYTGKKNALVACVLVAHPDDETIWAGGTLLMHPEWQWTVISLCRAGDLDRAARFQRAAETLGVNCVMADLDDGPEQAALSEYMIQQTALSLLPSTQFDIILTHSPFGEYTRHRRHEEIGSAVGNLWAQREIHSHEMWMFAYQDSGRGGKGDPPAPIATAHQSLVLTEHIWLKKYQVITGIYGFTPESYEAEIVQRKEAFWCFTNPVEYEGWLESQRREYESTRSL